MAKDDRSDAEIASRVAQRFGLRTVYKRSLLAELREAHSPGGNRTHGAGNRDHARRSRGRGRGRPSAGVSERDVQTQLEYAFFAAGATGLSYPSIVGAGPDGAVLHWDKNSRCSRTAMWWWSMRPPSTAAMRRM